MTKHNWKLTLLNHPNCPNCGSSNTTEKIDYGRCLCGGNCWSHPECLDCGYGGYMNSEGIFWDWDNKKMKPTKVVSTYSGE